MYNDEGDRQLRYFFINEYGDHLCVECSMSEITERSVRLAAEGWRRVWDVPRFYLHPSYWEAYEESVKVVEEEDRQRAKDRKEAERDLREAIREELR